MCDLLTVFKNKFRKIENLRKKCENLEGAIKFNKTCLDNRIYPVHVKIYIYSQVTKYNLCWRSQVPVSVTMSSCSTSSWKLSRSS